MVVPAFPRRTLRLLPLLLLLLSLLLNGCAQEVIPETSTEGGAAVQKITNSYQLLNMRKFSKIEGKAGQTMILTYAATVHSGTLELSVNDPSGKELWKISPLGVTNGSTEITLQRDGTYQFKVNAKNTSGSYEVSWQLK